MHGASNTKRSRLIALPVQTIEIPDGVILKRGVTEVMIKGTGAADAVKRVLDAAAAGGASVNEIRRLFDRSYASWVDALVHNLHSRRLLVPKNSRASPPSCKESPLEVFYWHFGKTMEQATAQLNRIRLVIIGINHIAKQLALALTASGYGNFQVFDHPRHRNSHFFETNGQLKPLEWPAPLDRPQSWNNNDHDFGDCLIVTSDCSGQQPLIEWNRLCLSRKVHFFPILLKKMVGYVGPMIIPGETACYECVTIRQQSHAIDVSTERCIDAESNEHSIIGFHPSMATMLGDVGAFELMRFYGPVVPKQPPGHVLELNLLAGTMEGRTVLKTPRCVACSPFHKTSPPSLSKFLFPQYAGAPQDRK